MDEIEKPLNFIEYSKLKKIYNKENNDEISSTINFRG